MGTTGTAASVLQASRVQTVALVSIFLPLRSRVEPLRLPERHSFEIDRLGLNGLQAKLNHFGVTPPGRDAVPGVNRLSRPAANQPCSPTLITQIVFPLKGFQMATFFPIATPLFCRVQPSAPAYQLIQRFFSDRCKGQKCPRWI